MSEKTQHTTASLREKMLNRYNDGLDHKHNKSRHTYRKHCRSHPVITLIDSDEETLSERSTGSVRALKLRRTRKRQDKGLIH